MKKVGIVSAVAIIMLTEARATAAVIQSESFDAQDGGVGALDFSAFGGWTVTQGAVNLVGAGFFDSYPDHGLYVDLSDSANKSTMVSTPLFLNAGLYSLSFDLGFDPAGPTNNRLTVSVGSIYSEKFVNSDAGAAPTFNVIERTFTVDQPGNYSIQFDHKGKGGFIIDDVVLDRIDGAVGRVPEPGPACLLALSTLLVSRRRS